MTYQSFMSFWKSCFVEEHRKVEEIPHKELNQILAKFVLGVRKKNGDEYEPSSVRAFLQSIDRQIGTVNLQIMSGQSGHQGASPEFRC